MGNNYKGDKAEINKEIERLVSEKHQLEKVKNIFKDDQPFSIVVNAYIDKIGGDRKNIPLSLLFDGIPSNRIILERINDKLYELNNSILWLYKNLENK